MRMLYLFPSMTVPVTNGAQVRARALLRHLAADLGWRVDFWCPCGSPDRSAWGDDAPFIGEIHIPGPAPMRGAQAPAGFLARVRRLLAPAGGGAAHPSCISARMRRYRDPRLAGHVEGLLRRAAYDAVLVSYVWMSPLVERVLGRRRRPMTMLDTIDIQYVREERLARFREDDATDFAREKALELSVIARYDVVIAITRHDEALLRRELPAARLCTVEVVPAPPPKARSSASHDLVFLGADNEANRLAVRHLLVELVPRIRGEVPALTVSIGGTVSEADEVRREAARAGVALAGRVPSAGAFFKSGRVFAAPIVAGGGVKVKILEAMACGVPVVTTPVGAEGIDCEDGADCVIARDDGEFVRGVVGLLRSPSRRAALAARARERLRARRAGGAPYREFDALLRRAFP